MSAAGNGRYGLLSSITNPGGDPGSFESVSRRDAILLRAAAIWTAFVWGIFLRNLLFGDTDRSTGFKVVHSVLAVVSLAFAAVIWTVAQRSSRRSADRVGTRS